MVVCRRNFGKILAGGGLATVSASALNRPKLLVLVLIELLRQDLLDGASGQFVPGGLRRVLYRGAHFPDCRHLASTFPACSITTLATGAWPAEHGIVADSWFDRASRKPIPASAESLLATTLWSEAAHSRRAYVLGMDQTATTLFAGSGDSHPYWMDSRGEFTTLGDVPEWLTRFNAAHNPADKHDARWMAVDAKPGVPPLRTLAWDPARPAEFRELYQGSPFAQEAQFDLLAELIERESLGTGDSTDVVCLIAGSTAKLGYDVGGRSPLLREMVLNLDRNLQSLLVRLDQAVGEGAYNVVLAGAHGAPPEPPEQSRARMAVGGESVAQAVDQALVAQAQGRVAKYLYPFLYLDPLPGRDPDGVRLVAARAALQHRAVAGFYTAGGQASTQDGWERRFRNSFHPRRSGDVMLAYHPEYVEDYGQGRGISYGSLYNYDVRVPLCFYGPSFRAGVYEAPVESIDVAPTLARLAGLPAPSSSMGRVLGEAFAE
jgi:hypothetical protein